MIIETKPSPYKDYRLTVTKDSKETILDLIKIKAIPGTLIHEGIQYKVKVYTQFKTEMMELSGNVKTYDVRSKGLTDKKIRKLKVFKAWTSVIQYLESNDSRLRIKNICGDWEVVLT
jgi:hypothetical protein